MKTPITLPVELFARANAHARSMHLSRSELFVLAVREYLERHDHERITAGLEAGDADRGAIRGHPDKG